MKNIIISTHFELEELINDSVKNALKELDKKPVEKKILTIREAFKYLNISRPTLLRWRKQGKIKGIKVEGKVLFRKEDLDAFLENNREA